MAPGTTIGSATPISGSGDDLGDDLRNKLIGNSVSKIRGLAELRGRNADWGEDAVRDGISAHSGEAIELNIVEYIADDLDDLLAQIDGVEVKMDDGRELVLNTEGAEIAYNDTNFIEDFLAVIADPNIAFLLLSLGSLAIFIEIIHPGGIFPGVFGVISLLLGFFALSVLPFNWAGVALIMFAFILFGLEMFITSHGVLGTGGAVSLILGGMLLTSGNPPEFRVDLWVVLAIAAPMIGLAVLVMLNAARIRGLPAQIGIETVVGRTAVARSPLNPAGFVFMDGEYWSAEAENGEVNAGERVLITQIKGLRLKVKKLGSKGE
jgi:membrane-bound serine protease (ClpP class)